MLAAAGRISRDSTGFSVSRSVSHTWPSSRKNVRGASVLSGPSPGSHDMVNSINTTYCSLRSSTCFVPGPPCNDHLTHMIIITQEEGGFLFPLSRWIN